MEFKSQICTTCEQSERLLALGLKKETADMVILEHPRKEGRYFYSAKEDANWDGFPAWSLHRLMEMVSFNLKDKKGYIYDFTIEDNNTISYYYFAEQFWHCYKYWGKSNLYDNFIDCIEWLIKEGYFNKDYLEA